MEYLELLECKSMLGRLLFIFHLFLSEHRCRHGYDERNQGKYHGFHDLPSEMFSWAFVTANDVVCTNQPYCVFLLPKESVAQIQNPFWLSRNRMSSSPVPCRGPFRS